MSTLLSMPPDTNTRRLQDKVALITGAGSIGPGWGNGKAIAALFAREGAQVFAVDLNRDAVEETRSIVEAAGGRCTTHIADVTSAEHVQAMTAACMAAFGRLDIVVNNVGIRRVGGPVEQTEEDWDHVMDTNAKSVFLVSKHALPALERQGGAIVNVSSVASIRWSGVPHVSYAASKAAVNQMGRVIAAQYARRGVRVNTVLPGMMNTPMISEGAHAAHYGDLEAMVKRRNALVPMGRMGDAWDVAHAALFLASDEARYITGAELVVDGGLACQSVSPA